MRANEFIAESTNTNLLIVDVQPEYASFSDYVVDGVRDMIQRANGKIVIVFNDFGGGDEPEQVAAYLAGINPENDGYEYDEELDDYVPIEQTPVQLKLQRAQFVQKEYGFLRPMMDQGISDRTIIQLLRLMYQNKVGDSRELDYETLPDDVKLDISNCNFDWDNEGISVQEWVPVSLLKQLSPFYMMGGGRNECLREIELICNAFNIRYTRIDRLIY